MRFLLAAGAIGMLFKESVSIPGAEVGCKLRTPRRSVWSTTPQADLRSRERARPDPTHRAQRHGGGQGGHGHHVSLDKVIKPMKQTGANMKVKYKETARGGLAVNVIEC